MRFTAAAAAAGFAATASASVMGHHDNSTAPAAPVYVTDVVTAYTTYCPEPTEIEQNGKTYTVTEATTLTISDCEGGCTVTTPVYSSLVTSCSTCETETPAVPVEYPAEETTPVAPVVEETTTAVATYPIEETTTAIETIPVETHEASSPVAPVYPVPTGNGTTPVQPTGTGAVVPSGSDPAPFEGAAAKAGVAGMSLFGLVAAVFAL